jgi:hypothetical protein
MGVKLISRSNGRTQNEVLMLVMVLRRIFVPKWEGNGKRLEKTA